jgi:tripartite-type tricarboxylate transporter receptor subunit TctC
VARLNGAINEALQSAELKASFGSLGIEPRSGTPEDFAALLAQDAPRWLDIIRITGIRLE